MDAVDLIVVSDIFGRTPELEELASELWGKYEKIHVECIQTKYMHGFMNKRSENFDDAGYREFIGRMK